MQSVKVCVSLSQNMYIRERGGVTSQLHASLVSICVCVCVCSTEEWESLKHDHQNKQRMRESGKFDMRDITH